MSRPTRETHIYYSSGDDEVQIESYDKRLNQSVMKLSADDPDAVSIYDDELAPEFLRAAVKRKNVAVVFRRTQTEEARRSRSEAGKAHVNNLRNQ